MFHIVLVEPEIPPNTGNVIRLAANTGCTLHLIEPLGFSMDDKHMRRAGLDYHEYATLQVHASLEAALQRIRPGRLFALSTRGTVRYDQPEYRPGYAFLFGPETRGRPAVFFRLAGCVPPLCPWCDTPQALGRGQAWARYYTNT